MPPRSVLCGAARRTAQKIVPHGPLIRLAAPLGQLSANAAAPGVVHDRDDWNAGRDLSTEERRCGLLLRVRDSAFAGRCEAPPLPEAVVKAQTSDFQVNEVDLQGSAAFLERAPKGRWRKISRQRTHLVENTSTPFSHPDKSYNPLVLSHGEYVRRIGRLPEDSPLLQFVMYRDGHTMDSVYNRLRYELGVESDAVSFRSDGVLSPPRDLPSPSPLSPPLLTSPTMGGPPGGSFGCITQFGCCVGITREQLAHVSRHYNLHPLLVDPRGYFPADDFSALRRAPWGYLYRILLRCVNAGTEAAVLDGLRNLSEAGFVNYFGVERFGISDRALFEMSAMAAQGDYRAAAGGYFHSLAESSPLHYEHFLAYVNADPSTAAAFAERWADVSCSAKCSRTIQRALAALAAYHKGDEDDDGAKRLWGVLGLDEVARRSAAEFAWNAMATQRVLSAGASRVAVGDVIACPADARRMGGEQTYRIVRTPEEAEKYSITDVVLPVGAGNGESLSGALFPTIGCVSFEQLYREFSMAHHLDFLLPSDTSTSQSTTAAANAPQYRPLVVRPRRLQAAVIDDPSSCAALKNDLFLRQERRPLESLDLDYAIRVRQPSPFNVSERFAERMAMVRHRHPGTHTVALSFLLPADTSPLVALRECFSLKYPNFTDLYFTS